MMILSEINLVESACFFIALAMQAAYLSFRKVHKGGLILSILAMVPATLLASASFTQFLSWDESYIFYDIVNFSTSTLPQWKMGAFRTSITLFGPSLGLLQNITGLSKDLVLVLAKISHWVVGVFIVSLIIDQMYKLRATEFSRPVFHVVLYNSILLLPVVSLALKTLNYDLLSMLLAILGSIWLAWGIFFGNKVMLFASIAAMTFAAHEKLIASPFLLLALIGATARLAVSPGFTWKQICARVPLWSALTTGSSLGLFALSHLVVNVTKESERPGFTTTMFFQPFHAALWPIRNFLIPQDSGFLISQNRGLPGFLTGIVLTITVVLLASMFLVVASRILRMARGMREQVTSQTILNKVVYVKLGLLLAVSLTGVLSTFIINTQIWPLIPVRSGHYLPTATFNGIALHYGSKTFLTHTVASSAWACSVFVNNIPTVLLLILIVCCIQHVLSIRKNSSKPEHIVFNILAICFMIAPVLYGILQIPLYPRYLNMFILGTIIFIIPDILLLRFYRPVVKVTAGVLGLILLVGEVLPFQPLFSAFRPIWSNYSKEINVDPCFGRASPWYPGWGEELYEAYREIRKMEPDCPERITLFHNFPGALIRPDENFVTYSMPIEAGQFEYSYGDCDYYIISRNGISTYPDLKFPYTVQPLFTIADRGFVKAWVFSGNDLQKQNVAYSNRNIIK